MVVEAIINAIGICCGLALGGASIGLGYLIAYCMLNKQYKLETEKITKQLKKEYNFKKKEIKYNNYYSNAIKKYQTIIEACNQVIFILRYASLAYGNYYSYQDQYEKSNTDSRNRKLDDATFKRLISSITLWKKEKTYDQYIVEYKSNHIKAINDFYQLITFRMQEVDAEMHKKNFDTGGWTFFITNEKIKNNVEKIINSRDRIFGLIVRNKIDEANKKIEDLSKTLNETVILMREDYIKQKIEIS